MFGAAALVRVAVAAQLWNLPLVRTPKLDSFEYVSWARRLAAGDFAWPIIPAHGPGYPFFLAALLAIGAGSLHLAIAAQALVGALAAALIAATAREWFGPAAGLFAGLAYALYGPAVLVDTSILSEGLLLFLLALALFLLAREPVSIARAAAAGAAVGAAALVRPTAIAIAAACVLWVIRRAVGGRLQRACAFAAACAIVVAPALVASLKVSHSVALQGYGGVNFYIGNSPMHVGRPVFRLGAGWDALNAEAARAGITDPAAQDRYYVAKTFREIREHPGAFLELLANKALWLVQAEEVRDSHSYYFFAEQSPVVRALPRMALLFPLACGGAVALLWWTPRRATLLWYYAAAAAATSVLLVVGTRYRMPMVPALAILAGVGLFEISERSRAALKGCATGSRAALKGCATDATGNARRFSTTSVAQAFRTALPCGVAILAAIVVSHLLSDPRNRNVAEEWALTGSALVTEHNLSGAEAAYRRALELDPGSGLAWDGLGLVHYDAGRLAPARDAFARALAHDPDSSRAVFHMALLDEREGRAGDAIRGYRRAMALSPHDADITYHFAVALGMAGQSAEARTEMRRAVELAPSNGEAWLDLCLLSLDVRDVAGADAALQRARELGANPQRLAFASDALDRARPRD